MAIAAAVASGAAAVPVAVPVLETRIVDKVDLLLGVLWLQAPGAVLI